MKGLLMIIGACLLASQEAASSGCPAGWYGDDCAEQCGSCKDDEACNWETGACPNGCQPGMNGTLCKEESLAVIKPPPASFTPVHVTTPLPADSSTHSAPPSGWEIAPRSKFYSCIGRQVTFPWRFQTTEGTNVQFVRWLFDNGKTSVYVALETKGYFSIFPKYEKRVAPLVVGGFSLSDVTTKDSGNYRMEVMVAENGSINIKTHAVFLRVTDGLRTEDDSLLVLQDPNAVWDQTVNQWVTRLTCGPFAFWSPPPFHVEWTTPTGASKTSYDYQNGSFNLNLHSPVVGGNYTCVIPEQSPAVCYQGNHPVSASVSVDEEKARLTVLEAEQRTLRQEMQAERNSQRNVTKALEVKHDTVTFTLRQEMQAEMDSQRNVTKAFEVKHDTLILTLRQEMQAERDSHRNVTKALKVKHDEETTLRQEMQAEIVMLRQEMQAERDSHRNVTKALEVKQDTLILTLRQEMQAEILTLRQEMQAEGDSQRNMTNALEVKHDKDIFKLTPLNGDWGAWTPYGSCSGGTTCYTGTQQRTRVCDNPAPANGGSSCAGLPTDTRMCTPRSCPTSCVDSRSFNPVSGVVTIYPDNVTPVEVYCDQDTDGGGWAVFQRRQDGTVDFYRNWTEYQNRFGDLNGEFWIGLDALHTLTSSQPQDMRVDLTFWNLTRVSASYSGFTISDGDDNYRLNFTSFLGGTAGDSLSYNHGMQFSTKDAEHDTASITHCAQKYRGAWWYKSCSSSNLNAQYKTSSSAPMYDGLHWRTAEGYHYSMKATEMKLRPR